MRVRRALLVISCVACGLAAFANTAIADSVADLNSFTSAAVTSSPTYNDGFGPAAKLVNNVAEGGSPFIFADNQSGYYVNISGLNGTSLSALRIFDDGWDARTPSTISVYYSSANTTSLDPASYTSWGTANPVVTNGGRDYANVTSNPAEVGQPGTPVHYVDINAAIPTGTRSVLLGFSAATVANGPALAEIQGIVGNNLLLGKTATTSSEYGGPFVASHLTDGLAAGFAFADWDTNRTMAITGFDSSVGLIRVWKGEDRIPDTVTIGSTSVDGSINPADYTALTTISGLMAMFNAQGYADIAVNAPAGTKGLGFVWGAGSNASGTEILDIQAFATVPEPSSIVLLVCGLVSLLAYAWRKRK